MCVSDEPVITFNQMIGRAQPPTRADRSAMGTLPSRGVQYCEALTSATGFGWWVFPPIDLEVFWDDDRILWRCDDVSDWLPLQDAAQFPDYVEEWDRFAPVLAKGCSPPFLTALPESGFFQLWTGLIVETAPDWHLLVRSPVNMPPTAGIGVFEAIIETDRWFGPLFANLRITRSHTTLRLRSDYPLIQVQPIPRRSYSRQTLERMKLNSAPSELTPKQWRAYYESIVEPNTRPDRPFGAYAAAVRKGKRRIVPKDGGTPDTCPVNYSGLR